MNVNVAGVPVPVEIVDEVELFPTMSPSQPFLLANLDTILHYANLFRGGRRALPNEVWFALEDDEEERLAFVSQHAGHPLLLVSDGGGRGRASPR